MTRDEATEFAARLLAALPNYVYVYVYDGDLEEHGEVTIDGNFDLVSAIMAAAAEK